jgi:hypothetical protein
MINRSITDVGSAYWTEVQLWSRDQMVLICLSIHLYYIDIIAQIIVPYEFQCFDITP